MDGLGHLAHEEKPIEVSKLMVQLAQNLGLLPRPRLQVVAVRG
jgi:hypothetical protein